MERPDVRIGWLRMLAKVYGRHPGDLYRDILADIDRLIAAAESERARRALPPPAPAADETTDNAPAAGAR